MSILPQHVFDMFSKKYNLLINITFKTYFINNFVQIFNIMHIISVKMYNFTLEVIYKTQKIKRFHKIKTNLKLTLSPEHKISQKKTPYFFSKNILFLFFFALNSLFLHAQGNDSTIVSANQNATIYVGSDITIQGSAYIYNAEIIHVDRKNLAQKAESQKKSYLPSDEVAVSKKNILKNNSQKARYKKLQKELSEKLESCFYSDSEDAQFSKRTKQLLVASTASNVLRISDSGKTINFPDYNLNDFEIQLENQKYYTTISHLLSDRWRDSFLRGPPLLS